MNKKVAAGVAATVAAASIATNLTFEPGELLHSAAYLDSHTRVMQTGELQEVELEYTEPEELSRQDQLRTWFLKLPVPVKAVFLLPLWALGAIPVSLGSAALSAAAPIWSRILSFVLQAAVLVGIFCLVYKLIFPEKKVIDLFKKKKSRRWLLFGVVAVTALDAILAQFLDGWPAIRVLILVGGGFGILCLLWHRICGRFKGPEPKIKRTRLKLEYQ